MAKEAPTIAITPAERQAREKLALCARSLHKIGVYDLAGHISMRIPDSDGILITPGAGLDKARLTGADMTTIDADGNHVGGPYPPPLETPIHTVVHAARPDLGSVAHLHAHWSTVFSIVERPMDIVLLPATTLGKRVPTFDIPHLVTTVDLAQQLNAALGDEAAILMRWHGITVVGLTVEQMFERALFIEENARLLWEATALGGALPVPPEGFPNMDANRAGRAPGDRTFNYYANLERPVDEQTQEGRAARGMTPE